MIPDTSSDPTIRVLLDTSKLSETTTLLTNKSLDILTLFFKLVAPDTSSDPTMRVLLDTKLSEINTLFKNDFSEVILVESIFFELILSVSISIAVAVPVIFIVPNTSILSETVTSFKNDLSEVIFLESIFSEFINGNLSLIVPI